jgi:ppGpp synthetase/RelA/SpoT-type nucleotidyltranferase
MNIQNYIEDGHSLYEEFSKVVADILKAAIGNNYHPFGIQQIQYRSKSVKSLSNKLKNRDLYHSDEIEAEIKDLAGCRVIFYHNGDLNSFLASSIIYDNFDVKWDQSKAHHPDNDAKVANDYYMANHFMISLMADRLNLPEFSKFTGFRCEIQVQTLLNHAWAETVHNITYKQRESTGYGARLMESIDERLKNIMTEYLLPAGYEFQKVKRDYSQFVQGQEIFDSGICKDIEAADNNNDLHDLLERYKDYVLPNYTEYISYEDEIYGVINASLSKAKGLNVVDIETRYGTISGKSYKDILSVCLEILSYVRYLNIERTRTLFIDIYSTFAEHSDEKVYVEHLERFAGYNYDEVAQSGLHIQEHLLDDLLAKPNKELLRLSGYAIPICKAILQPSFNTTDWSYNQVAIGTINLSGNDALKTLRKHAIELLKKLYFSDDESFRSNVKSCLDIATNIPFAGYSDELLNIVLSNSNDVIRIYADDINRQTYQEIQICEERVHFLYLWAKSVSQNTRKPDESISLAKAIMVSVGEYRAKVNSNGDYLKYKILVGFRSVFDQEWDDKRLGVAEENAFREKKISEFVESIDDECYAGWVKLVATCASTESSDLATFIFFKKFLALLASSKPDIALRLIKDNNAGIERFLVSILMGFADSGRLDILDSVIEDYVKRGDRLWECAKLIELKPSVNRVRLIEMFKIAKQKDQVSTMIQVLAAVVANPEVEKDELSTLFFPIIAELTSRGNPNWVYAVWFKPEANNFLEFLNIEQAKVVLENLVFLAEIDFHAEQVIMPIAKKFPKIVINYFGERLNKQRQKSNGGEYDAIPYEFYVLAGPLSKVPEKLVDTVLDWYNADSSSFKYRGGDLIAKVFPKFNDRLETKLIDLINTRGEEIFDFISSILRNYKGEVFLHCVCKVLIANLPANSKYLSKVEIILENSGVLHGEFGVVELYEQKKAEILHWLEDEDPKIKSFATDYVLSLDRQRAVEQKRAEEEIEMRKRNYGE